MISFTIPIAPKSVQKGARSGWSAKLGRVIHYSDKDKENYQATIALLAKEYRPEKPIDGAVIISMVFLLPRPAKYNGKKYPTAALYCETRPDWDNLAKGTIDALSRVGFWHDDKQIVQAIVTKMFHGVGESPKIQVDITSVKEEK